MLSASIVVSLATLLAVPPGAQPARPDFSGTWLLNVAQSDYGPFPPPARRTDVIDHRGNTLEVTRRDAGRSGEERVGKWVCTTDRVECTNLLGGNEMKSTSHWEGSTLVVATKMMFQGQDAFIEDRWTLAADGRTLTITRHAVSPQGAADQKFVLERAR